MRATAAMSRRASFDVVCGGVLIRPTLRRLEGITVTVPTCCRRSEAREGIA